MRIKVCGFLLVGCFVGLFIAPVRAQEDTGQTPQEYLEVALDYIQANSIYSDRIDDWAALRAEAFAMIEGTTTTQDTYPAIDYVIEQLGDHHSQLYTSEERSRIAAGQAEGFGLIVLANSNIVIGVYDESPAALGGIQSGDIIVAIDGEPPQSNGNSAFAEVEVGRTAVFSIQRANEGFDVPLTPALVDAYRKPESQRFGHNVGYTEWFELIGINHYDTFPNDAKRAIKAVNDPSVCGWIVDLRQNFGGNSYPMLLGVGPILGEGEIGGFVDNTGSSSMLSYQAGQIRLNGVVIDSAFYPIDPMPGLPVAVLTSPYTGSAGENVLISFIGRPYAKLFGEASAGLTTGNNGIELSDGAFLNLAQVYMMDRNGLTYDGPVVPNEIVPIDWVNYGTENDPVIQAAMDWLDSQYNCR